MTRAIINRIVISIVVALLLNGNVLASKDRAFFWKLKTETATIYLLGSIHFANKSFYPLRDTIEQAFEASDNLVVEVDMSEDSQNNYQSVIAEMGIYRNGETIKDHVSQDTYEQLVKYLARVNIPIEAVERFRPGVVVLMLTAAEASRLGYTPEAGIDMHFISRARGDKNIMSLETLEQQVGALLNAPEDLLLEEEFGDIAESEKMMRQMVALWKQGDEQGMHKILFEDVSQQSAALAPLYESLFYQRNETMVARIRSFIETGGSYFVIVGAGHLLGERGIISLLQQAGYEPERL